MTKKTKPKRKPLIKLVPQPVPALAPPPVTRKLDLACGQVPAEGFEGVDVWAGAQHVVDLMKFPWPFEDSSVAEVRCSHYIEHIPQYPLVTKPDGSLQNPFFAFFDELYRILVPGGWAEIICPNARSNRGFQDPTHTRYIVGETFFYLSQQFREVNKLDHYNVSCNFGANIAFTIDNEVNLKADLVKNNHIVRDWNVIHDWIVKLQSQKGIPQQWQAPS